jgi:hypothetical protein
LREGEAGATQQAHITTHPSLLPLQRALLAQADALAPADVSQCVWALGQLGAGAARLEPALLPELVRRATALAHRFQPQVCVLRCQVTRFSVSPASCSL